MFSGVNPVNQNNISSISSEEENLDGGSFYILGVFQLITYSVPAFCFCCRYIVFILLLAFLQCIPSCAGMEESARVLGVGVGLFIIILVWAVALAGLLMFTRMDVGSAIGILGLASVITVVLLIVPREQKSDKVIEETPELVLTDSMFVWRTVMVVLMSVSGVLGAAVVAVDYGLHAVKPSQIKKAI